ncbi:putative ribonuclease H-like domain-containing protein [Tanacetum coccineum]
MVPKVVLMRSGLVSLTTARSVNTAQPRTTVNSGRPMTNVFNKAHLIVRRPMNNKTTTKNSNFNQKVNTARPKVVVNDVKGNHVNAVKALACWIQVSDGLGPQKKLIFLPKVQGNPQIDLQEQGVIDSGCSRHMTSNMSYLTDYEEVDGGYVAFGGNPKGGKITGKGTIKTGTLDFKDLYFVRELNFNLFSVSQMCDKKNSVLFNDTECIVLSPNFKLTDESHVLLKVPRKNNMYSVDLKNIVPKGGITCIFAKVTYDESKLWHKRLGNINFKTINKLVKGNHVIGLPSKLFEDNQTCVACQKGKQHRASCKSKTIKGLVIRCDNGTEFKNKEMNQFCERKCIKREFSIARTPQQNGAERKNSSLYEAARKSAFLSFMRPFGCPVTILNTIDHLGKFDGKADEGFFVAYLIKSKSIRVFNSRTRIVEENLHVQFIVAGNQSNGNVGTKAYNDAGDDEKRVTEEPGKEGGDPSKEDERDDQEKDDNVNNTNNVNAASSNEVNTIGGKTNIKLPIDPDMPELEDYSIFENDEDVGAEADMNNLDTTIHVSLIPTERIHKDHPLDQVIGELHSATQTRNMSKNLEEYMFVGTTLKQRTNHKDLQNCLFACFLSQEEP